MDTFENLEKLKNELDTEILNHRKEVRTDRLDISFNELINMYETNELIITPEYQRTFRWDKERQSKFIESILLGIPIPPIFVAENSDSIWELVDGLQRISTIFSFFGSLKSNEEKNNLSLKTGSILKKLEGFTVDTIPLKYKLALKRAVCRVEIIKFDSKFNMRYELFNRLNTGGLDLSKQEIRNCIFRGLDNQFNTLINKLGNSSNFSDLIYIREQEKEMMYCSELVLRYFTLKNKGASFEKNIQNHMDNYMLEISENPQNFNFQAEETLFVRVIKVLKNLIDEEYNPFKLKTLNFSTSMYDPLMIAFSEKIDSIETLSKEELKSKIEALKNEKSFKANIGPASSSKYRLQGKIDAARQIFR